MSRFTKARQPRAGHFAHAASRSSDQFRGTRHGTLQRGDVGSKGDGQAAHAPGMESTLARYWTFIASPAPCQLSVSHLNVKTVSHHL